MSMTHEELERRRRVVGASEVGLLFGLPHYGGHTVSDLWWLKKYGTERESKGNASTALGTRLEPTILEMAEERLGCPIKVGEDDKGLRLTIQHPKRGLTYFSELSMGEKYAQVIPIAVKAVGPGGLFVIPQEAWEGLQPRVRKQIVAMLKGTHVTAITAQCADGPLVAQEVAA